MTCRSIQEYVNTECVQLCTQVKGDFIS